MRICCSRRRISPTPLLSLLQKNLHLQKKQRGTNALSTVSEYNSIFPEKVGFTLPKLYVKFIHRGYGLVVENNIMGIQLKCITSKSVEEVGESLRLDIQLEFSEIYLLREVDISIVELLKLDVVSSVYIPLQVSKLQNLKANNVGDSTPELRRTSSFDKTWEENVAEFVANELVLQLNTSTKSGPLAILDQHDEPIEIEGAQSSQTWSVLS